MRTITRLAILDFRSLLFRSSLQRWLQQAPRLPYRPSSSATSRPFSSEQPPCSSLPEDSPTRPTPPPPTPALRPRPVPQRAQTRRQRSPRAHSRPLPLPTRRESRSPPTTSFKMVSLHLPFRRPVQQYSRSAVHQRRLPRRLHAHSGSFRNGQSFGSSRLGRRVRGSNRGSRTSWAVA